MDERSKNSFSPFNNDNPYNANQTHAFVSPKIDTIVSMILMQKSQHRHPYNYNRQKCLCLAYFALRIRHYSRVSSINPVSTRKKFTHRAFLALGWRLGLIVQLMWWTYAEFSGSAVLLGVVIIGRRKRIIAQFARSIAIWYNPAYDNLIIPAHHCFDQARGL